MLNICWLIALLIGNVGYTTPRGMQPIVERYIPKPKPKKAAKKTKVKTIKKASKVKKQIPQRSVLDPKIIALNQLGEQIVQLQKERKQLLEKKHALLDAFTKTQAAFIFKLPPSEEVQHQQSLLLALSSKSMSEFVHQSVMLPYLVKYLVQKNQQCANLLQNIQRINFYIESNQQKEQELIKKWYAQKKQIIK